MERKERKENAKNAKDFSMEFRRNKKRFLLSFCSPC